MNCMFHRNILIDKYKSIYFFLPKTGSTSVKSNLAKLLEMENTEELPHGIHNPKTFPFPFVKQNELDSTYKEYFKFTIVRNPWSRLVSCYRDKIRPAEYNKNGIINGVAIPLINCSDKFYGGMSFGSFVDVVCSISDATANNHFRSQLFQLTNSEGELLVNYIGKLESLNESLNEITQKTGIPGNEMPHFHKTSSKPYLEYYNNELVEKVKQRFKEDIDFFEYEFQSTTKMQSFGTIKKVQRSKINNSTFMKDLLKEKQTSLSMQNKKE